MVVGGRFVQPLKWHGGKSYLAKWIVGHFPDRRKYSHFHETHAGGLSVLFSHNPDGKAETVNDLNSELSNFWSVLSKTPDRMLRELWGTPLSESVWDASLASLADSDSVRRATAFFIRYRQSRQGLGKSFVTPTTRIRRGMDENASSWLSAVDGLFDAHCRLIRVGIRTMDAVDFIQMYDHPRALFYVDPPYVHSQRSAKNAYEFEMTDDQHRSLLDCLVSIKGMFVLSGYHSELYDQWARDNHIVIAEKKIDNKASGKKTKEIKTEVLWMNYL